MLKVPYVDFKIDENITKRFYFSIGNFSNGTNFNGGVDVIYHNESLSEVLKDYVPNSGSRYIEILQTGYFLKLENKVRDLIDDVWGDIYLSNIVICDKNKNQLFGFGSLKYREGNGYGNKIMGLNGIIDSSYMYIENADTFAVCYANWQEKISATTSLFNPAFINSYRNIYTSRYGGYTDENRNYAIVGCSTWRLLTNQNQINTMKQAFFGENPSYDYPNYPFNPSQSGGGTGVGDKSSDIIDIPSIPPSVAINSKMLTMYNTTIGELSQLSDFLWSDNFIEDIKQLFGDPLNAIISLKGFFNSIEEKHGGIINLGNISTEISSNIVDSQYITLDCGVINIEEFFGSALDYNPYTSLELYLPFCGTISLNVDDFMGGSMNVTYLIDLLSGACVAHVRSIRNRDNTELNSVLYSVGGNCAMDIPITSNQSIGLTSAIIGSISASAIGVVSGGIGGTVGSAMSVSAMKQRISKNGNISSNVGTLSIKKPYVTINRPIQSVAENYSTFVGFPLNVNKKLKDVSGFTTVDSAILNFNALTEEKEMIMDLLQSGVFV